MGDCDKEFLNIFNECYPFAALYYNLKIEE